MKKILALALMLSSTLLFVACEEDGATNTGGENTGENVVTSNISSNETWETGNVYTLGGRITVESGATLTIEPGVVIKGQAGTGANASVLLVARGGKLNAIGTAEEPIIFTSAADNIQPGQTVSPNLSPDINGLWGGVIVLGRAKISASNDNGELSEVQIEGIPTSDANGLYGGNVDDDNSGTIAYVSIRHGGTNIGDGNEVNGLTLGGVGSGTSISNVEVVANQDDGIEWFGGTVNVSKVVIWNSNDDGLDTDQDWTGTCSDFIIVTPRGGSAFELDGPEGSSIKGGFHTFENGIVYAGSDIDHLVDWDATTNAALKNIYFYGIDAEYMATADFDPIESFGGSVPNESGNWQYTLADGVATDAVFTGVPSEILSKVAVNANTVGINTANFAWTWAAQSSSLSGIGL